VTAPLEIRPASPDDAWRLAELRWEFRAPRAPTNEDRAAFLHRATSWMRERLSEEGTWRCWVAVHNQVIVGHVWLEVIEKVPNPVAEAEWHGYITNLYVQEQARGGVGGALLDAALAWCHTQEVDCVVLWPTERSRSLYERKGFSVSASIMARSER